MAITREHAIKKSLLAQLEAKGASQPHFIDLTMDYMRLWKVKELLVADILERGVSYDDFSSTGTRMMKNNPSVKELQATNRQMLSILRELGLTTDKVDDPNVDI
ncbi:P27 family phage terminase small subunit [Eubacteriales bacterium OttesenSCG-928-A19]|nr:P27 family phage terminase small subunit [Eubacteriales bacterium OttesenSCG-928-A19]